MPNLFEGPLNFLTCTVVEKFPNQNISNGEKVWGYCLGESKSRYTINWWYNCFRNAKKKGFTLKLFVNVNYEDKTNLRNWVLYEIINIEFVHLPGYRKAISTWCKAAKTMFLMGFW